jgi:hypothetical protein
MNNTVNLFVGYGLAALLYIGYTVLLVTRRRTLRATVEAHKADQI